MALDGIFLSQIKNEINRVLPGARVDKIQQPEKDEVDFVFRARADSDAGELLGTSNPRLLLSASAGNPRVHFTAQVKENPAAPPMFCMFLRKHLGGAKFVEARQQALERILFLDFTARNELGDEVLRTLAIEIMGRHSNIILIDEAGKIMDAVKHIDEEMSPQRPIFPGLLYRLPPMQEKPNPLTAPAEEIVRRIESGKDAELSRALLDNMQGISPVAAREIAVLACRGAEARSVSLTSEQRERLCFFIGRIAQEVSGGEARPVMASDAATGKPLDFSFMPITQYGLAASTKEFDTFSTLLDQFYRERDHMERFNQRAQDILRLLTNTVARIGRKLENQRAELEKCAGRERLKTCADLISANLYRLQKGQTSCELADFYQEGAPLTEIRLDPRLTPAQNAQKYYREYHKAATGEQFLRAQIESGKQELAYLDTVFDELTRASGESGLAEIRAELAAEGYLRAARKGSRAPAPRETGPLRFRSADGFDIFVGRNNRQNDRLTLKTAAKNDLWLHTRNIPGAHVILATGGLPAGDAAITEAAELAAAHSHAKDSRQVPVDYTLVKNVHKPQGAKPGMVIYENFHTAYVNPKLPENAKTDSAVPKKPV